MDPKPHLSQAAILANIAYYHAELTALELKGQLIKEQILYWQEQLKNTLI